MEAAKSVARDAIDEEAETLNEISQQIWAFKELAFEEKQSHDALTGLLEEKGFRVQRSIGLETAFLASWECHTQESNADSGPHVAFLCEYDALPEIGHACGHNLIAEVGVGAALGVKAALQKHGKTYGKISVIGTPAEEGKGGKIDLLKAGLFDGVDVAMMAHPAPFSDARPVFLGTKRLIFVAHGKPSHAAGFPWEGVNALDAIVQAYVSVATLRQQLKPSCRVHVIITKGGTRTNIIPSEAEARVQIRSDNDRDLDDLDFKVKRCFQAAGEATGCTMAITDLPKPYECLLTNETLARLYETNAKNVGFELHTPYPQKVLGSTDMGNVSHVVASLHPTFDCGTRAANHTAQFARAAASPQAQGPTLSQAKILACVGLDVLLDPTVLENIKKDFHQDMAGI